MAEGYKHENYVYFRETCTDDGEVVRVGFPYEDIANLSLDNIGRQVPEPRSFVKSSSYMLKYWSPIIGFEAVMTLTYLKMHSAIDGEYTCVSITELSQMMRKTTTTVRKYLRILEEHSFIAIFRRLHLDKNNRETSPYIKIRLTVPMLTEEQVLALPEFLQEDHEVYIQEINGKV